jgi:HSP20 family protein
MEPWFADWPRFRTSFTDSAETMRVEEFTDGDDAVVRVELPGIDPDKDVTITVTDHTLRLHAERRDETKTDDKGGYRSEFRYGSFTRTVPLPVGATENDVKATYRDGILEVRVPIDHKSAEAKKIPVQRV